MSLTLHTNRVGNGNYRSTLIIPVDTDVSESFSKKERIVVSGESSSQAVKEALGEATQCGTFTNPNSQPLDASEVYDLLQSNKLVLYAHNESPGIRYQLTLA